MRLPHQQNVLHSQTQCHRHLEPFSVHANLDIWEQRWMNIYQSTFPLSNKFFTKHTHETSQTNQFNTFLQQMLVHFSIQILSSFEICETTTVEVLVLWLNQSPDYTEISRWYTGWKSMFSEEILRERNIKEHFRRALEMMHRVTDKVIGATTPLTSSINDSQPPPSLIQIPAMTPQLEFKELVSQRCSERGIILAPISGRREQDKQVSSTLLFSILFVSVQIYRVGMLSDSSCKNWFPTSLPQMLERALTCLL